MKYLVQAILIDDDAEKVIDSIKTDNFEETLDFVMKRHKSSTHYMYNVLDINTNELIVHTMSNKFGW